MARPGGWGSRAPNEPDRSGSLQMRWPQCGASARLLWVSPRRLQQEQDPSRRTRRLEVGV